MHWPSMTAGFGCFIKKIVALPKLEIKAFCTLVEHMLYSLIVMMH